MPESLQHAIDISCPPAALYAYVTQPWRWHEWHPSSRSAQASAGVLEVGDEFDELVALQPLSPLPLTLRRATRYRVLAATPPICWEAEGRMKDGWLRLRYEFARLGEGTRFNRMLSYDARGASRLLLPLLRRRTAELSWLAMQNLKQRMERSDAAI
jgi:hypothetical protein